MAYSIHIIHSLLDWQELGMHRANLQCMFQAKLPWCWGGNMHAVWISSILSSVVLMQLAREIERLWNTIALNQGE